MIQTHSPEDIYNTTKLPYIKGANVEEYDSGVKQIRMEDFTNSDLSLPSDMKRHGKEAFDFKKNPRCRAIVDDPETVYFIIPSRTRDKSDEMYFNFIGVDKLSSETPIDQPPPIYGRKILENFYLPYRRTAIMFLADPDEGFRSAIWMYLECNEDQSEIYTARLAWNEKEQDFCMNESVMDFSAGRGLHETKITYFEFGMPGMQTLNTPLPMTTLKNGFAATMYLIGLLNRPKIIPHDIVRRRASDALERELDPMQDQPCELVEDVFVRTNFSIVPEIEIRKSFFQDRKSGRTGIKMHPVRGHWRQLPDGRPRIWVKPHYRGDSSHGVIVSREINVTP